MKERFSDAKVGDKVYDRVYGFGEITYADNRLGKYPIGIKFIKDATGFSFTWSGRLYDYAAEDTLFYVDGENKYATERPTPKVPWDKVPVDTKVFVGADIRW